MNYSNKKYSYKNYNNKGSQLKLSHKRKIKREPHIRFEENEKN